MVDESGLAALGVELVAGDGFSVGDIEWRDGGTTSWPAKVILTRDLAETLFPEDPSFGVGEIVYISQTQPMTVAGVVEKLQAPWNGWGNIENSILVPRHMNVADTTYLVRAEPGRRDALMPEIEQRLAEREPGRIVQDMLTMEQTRELSYNVNNALVNILDFTVVIIVAITTLGVGGLTNFNVTRRVKQIGTRRALGASRGAILRYFLAENLLFTALGVALGAVLSIAVNYWLVAGFSVPRFSWVFMPVAMLGLVVISQIAVLAPARRAAQVPPAVATRTV
jgi:putative ABC transport system permease protein